MIKASKAEETQPIKTVTYKVEGTDVELGILRGQAKQAITALSSNPGVMLGLNAKTYDHLMEVLKMLAADEVTSQPAKPAPGVNQPGIPYGGVYGHMPRYYTPGPGYNPEDDGMYT